MPAIQFFKCLDLGEEMHAYEKNAFLHDLLSIEAINVAEFAYYQRTDARLRARLEKAELPKAPEPTRAVPRPSVRADSVEAVNLFTGLFGGKARGR